MTNQGKKRLPAEATRHLARGNKIEAIKITREQLGLDLKEAKELVENYNPVDDGVDLDATIPAQMKMPTAAINALMEGNMINAIRIVRTENHAGLKAAKDFVDEYIDENPVIKDIIRSVKAKARQRFINWLLSAMLVLGLCLYIVISL